MFGIPVDRDPSEFAVQLVVVLGLTVSGLVRDIQTSYMIPGTLV